MERKTGARPVATPDDAAMEELLERLREVADSDAETWPSRQLEWLAQAGAHRWFAPREQGGVEWSPRDLVSGYLKLAAACLTTTFVMTQRSGAVKRLSTTENLDLQRRWLPGLLDGSVFGTIGIAQLTTSRQHLGKPALAARIQEDVAVLDGYCPWVTGAAHADVLVLGAACDDGKQLLAATPRDRDGLFVEPPMKLAALSGSHTGVVRCNRVRVSRDEWLAGPVENVLSVGAGPGTGGVETSALALGLAARAVEWLEAAALARDYLTAPARELRAENDALVRDMWTAMADPSRSGDLRARANSHVLRATQSALVAAKGSGFVADHPVGRWCREALFFLVWSCPAPVAHSNLCEFAGLQP